MRTLAIIFLVVWALSATEKINDLNKRVKKLEHPTPTPAEKHTTCKAPQVITVPAEFLRNANIRSF